ncbi:hypothetical protein QGM71_12120 [Virgibacillus sp. C22-A2]|uniref:Uncharacterized protein n=1 Tax=Virgibacillus tibetensis TaxID=3042313 RepID=A0ABU6KFZ5_9BACI|nr:hypothetical protein [Virgibacillus sp. C22-A2]
MEEEFYQEELSEYEKQVEEIHTILDTLNQLKQDVDYIKDEVEEMRVKELLEKMNLMMDKTDEHLIKVENEINSQKEDYLQLKDLMNQDVLKKKAPRPSEYRRLQNMLQSYNNMGLSPNQPNSSMAANRMYRQPTSLNHSRRNGTFSNGQPPVPRSNVTKTFRNPQQELNKNIITRSSSSRKRKK